MSISSHTASARERALRQLAVITVTNVSALEPLDKTHLSIIQLQICSFQVLKSLDRIPYPDFLRPESYRSAAIIYIIIHVFIFTTKNALLVIFLINSFASYDFEHMQGGTQFQTVRRREFRATDTKTTSTFVHSIEKMTQVKGQHFLWFYLVL